MKVKVGGLEGWRIGSGSHIRALPRPSKTCMNLQSLGLAPDNERNLSLIRRHKSLISMINVASHHTIIHRLASLIAHPPSMRTRKTQKPPHFRAQAHPQQKEKRYPTLLRFYASSTAIHSPFRLRLPASQTDRHLIIIHLTRIITPTTLPLWKQTLSRKTMPCQKTGC